MTDIGRKSLPGRSAITIATDQADCTVIDFASFAGGVLELISGSTTAVTVYTTTDEDWETATYRPLYEMVDGVKTAVTISLATTDALRFPPACYDCLYIKLVGDAAGVGRVSRKG